MGPGGEHAGVAVDTTATVERKVAALMCHKSQLPDPDAVAQRVQDWSRANAELAGLPEGRSAELFRVIRIP
jgi:LmbE family N-acetylglucosaminyl deacetylase